MRSPLLTAIHAYRMRGFPAPARQRRALEAIEPPADPSRRDAKLARVEAILFAATEPVPARQLVRRAGLADSAEAETLVMRLQSLYDADGSAFTVERRAGGWRLHTRPAYHPWLVRLTHAGNIIPWTPAALETLTIVAYRQPITRAELEKIRGVGSLDVLNQLLERGWLRIAGRQATLGKPVLYGTTKQFLEALAVDGVSELPTVTD